MTVPRTDKIAVYGASLEIAPALRLRCSEVHESGCACSIPPLREVEKEVSNVMSGRSWTPVTP